jgi:cyanophycin synthetase
LLIDRIIRFVLMPIVRVYANFCFRIANYIKARHSPSGSPDLTYYRFECNQHQYEINDRTPQIIGIRDPNSGMVFNFCESYTDYDGIASLRLAADKLFCYQLLQSLDLPTPRHITIQRHELSKAFAFKNSCPSGIVIKPGKDTGDGIGVSIKPGSVREIVYSIALASIFSDEILVEEFCDGINYRLLYCEGEFIAASSRLPATVTGDGCSTLLSLINAANSGRRIIGDIPPYSPDTRPILFKIPSDNRIKPALKKQNLNLASVPKRGHIVKLQDICHWLWGGAYEDVTDLVCPHLVEAGSRAVRALGSRLAGIDVIAKDIGNCIGNNYIINEINTTPALLVHYEVQNRQNVRQVAGIILDKLFSNHST